MDCYYTFLSPNIYYEIDKFLFIFFMKYVIILVVKNKG